MNTPNIYQRHNELIEKYKLLVKQNKSLDRKLYLLKIRYKFAKKAMSQ